MDTLLTSNISKVNASRADRKPLYAADGIQNDRHYIPEPDYESAYFRRLAMNAEIFTAVGSRATALRNKAFIVASMSTGWNGYQAAEKYADKVRANISTHTGEKFLTVQRLGDALPPEVMKNDVFARNNLSNENAAELAALVYKDHVINAPADREGFLRALHDIHSMLQGASWEDWVFEKNSWGPEILLDTDVMILHKDHAYSRCGALEKMVAVAIQYGQPLPLMWRNGAQMDVQDIKGRDVPVVDQAWEDCKQLVDVVERGFRNEAGVSLILSRFMHEHWYQTGTGPILHDQVHHIVADRSEEDMQRLDQLKQVIFPYLAARCDWATLAPVLDNDKDLKWFWETHVKPTSNDLKDTAEIHATLFSYRPRGGFDHPEYHHLTRDRRDQPEPRQSFALADKKRRMLGAHIDVFDPKWHARLFEDYDFENMAPVEDETKKPDKNHLSFEQTASYIIMNAVKKSRPALDGGRRALYLGNPASGLRAAGYMHEHGIDYYREASTIYDHLNAGGESFFAKVLRESEADYNDQALRLMRNKDWRATYDIGDVTPLSTFTGIGNEIERKREAYDAERREGIGADGHRKLNEASFVCVKRAIDHDYQAVIIPDGPVLDPAQARWIMQAVLVATGQVERPYSGGKYDMEIFYDRMDGTDPVKIDMGDLILLLGSTVEHALDQADPADLRWHYVTMARLLDIYEKRMDPGRCNYKYSKDPESGEDMHCQIIDWNQTDPYLTSFIDEDLVKARAVYEMWYRMRAMPQPGVTDNVRGKLITRGIHAFDERDLRDLPEEYRQGKAWWEDNLTQQERMNIFRKGSVSVRSPAVIEPK